MPIVQLLFSFHGRINRRPFWLVTLTLIIVSAIVSFATMLAIIAPFPALIALGSTLGSTAGSLASLLIVALLFIVPSIPLLWIGLAVGAKRLHDRGKSAWWLLVFYAAPNVLLVLARDAGAAALVLNLTAAAIAVWGLVELGFLRGMRGPNHHGPDPLRS